MDIEKERRDILTQAIEERKRDVMVHQINIDNYRAAIAEIEANHSSDDDMVKFSDQMNGLLASSIVEQRKEMILLKVIEKQLEN